MEKIITHPLFNKAKKVIDSCETSEQRKVANKYIDLVTNRIYKDCRYNNTFKGCVLNQILIPLIKGYLNELKRG
jgi:hypothetical protein